MNRAYSATELLKKKFDIMAFDGRFRAAVGLPAKTGSWIIGGRSASGKTTFIFLLCKYLTQFDRVYYNSLEEGVRLTTQNTLQRTDMKDVKNRFVITREDIPEMVERLKKRKSQNIVVIDSIQHSMIKKAEYLKLTRMFPNKLFIWVTHFDDKQKPVGSVANFIWYDSDIKMTTEGFKMFADSRYSEGNPQPFVIYPKGAKQYWGNIK